MHDLTCVHLCLDVLLYSVPCDLRRAQSVPASKRRVTVLIQIGWILFQVDEAVAVLQAHQAKEAAQKSVTNPAVVPSV